MAKKYLILSGTVVAIMLLLFAPGNYSKSAEDDKKLIDHYLKKDCQHNLHSHKAINGSLYPSGLWAVGGTIFLSSPWQMY